MSCRTKSGEGALEPKGVCREKTKPTTTRTMVKAADCNVRNELDGGREIKRKRGEREGERGGGGGGSTWAEMGDEIARTLGRLPLRPSLLLQLMAFLLSILANFLFHIMLQMPYISLLCLFLCSWAHSVSVC